MKQAHTDILIVAFMVIVVFAVIFLSGMDI